MAPRYKNNDAVNWGMLMRSQSVLNEKVTVLNLRKKKKSYAKVVKISSNLLLLILYV